MSAAYDGGLLEAWKVEVVKQIQVRNESSTRNLPALACRATITREQLKSKSLQD